MSSLPGMLAGSEGFRASGSAVRVPGEAGELGCSVEIGGDFFQPLVMGNSPTFFIFQLRG